MSRVERLRPYLLIVMCLALSLSSCTASLEGKYGQELFDRTCALCHGTDGQGSPGRPAIGAGSNAVALTDEQIRGVITVGPGAMPSFARLTDEQIESLVEYLRVLQAGQPTG